MMEVTKADAEMILLDTITEEVMNSSRLNLEYLVEDRVRSSVCKRLGIEHPGKIALREDGVVGMIMDATQNYRLPLTKERLFQWNSMLFCDDHARPITIGEYRQEVLAVVSGALGKEHIHYVPPLPGDVEQEMEILLKWLEEDRTDDLVKSAVAHIWLIMIHPFEDGIGRIARAVSEMVLARSEDCCKRYYSLSSRIYKERMKYCDIVERNVQGDGDITKWIEWFLSCTMRAVEDSIAKIGPKLEKSEFWQVNSAVVMNERQCRMMNMLLDGALEDLTSSEWAKINHCSQDTAINDIKYLIEKRILAKSLGGCRSTRYVLAAKKPH